MREVRNIPKMLTTSCRFNIGSPGLPHKSIRNVNISRQKHKSVTSVSLGVIGNKKKKAACSSKLRLKVWAPLLSFHFKKNKEVKLPSVHHSGTGTRVLQLHRPKETRHTRSSSGRQATVDFPSFIVTSSHRIRSEKATKTHTKAARLQKKKKKKPGRLLYVSGRLESEFYLVRFEVCFFFFF